MNNELFGLYYINLEKVYELKIIINNFELNSRIVENNRSYKDKNEISSNISSSLHNILGANIAVSSSVESLRAIKVSDSFSVKQTKSNILNGLLKLVKEKDSLETANIGDLIKLEDISFKLANEDTIRLIKMLSQDIIKGQIANGIDINKTINALTKDYSYVLFSPNKKIIIKIPISTENEFESKYSIDDLLFGKVNVIGVYKGKLKGKSLNNTFEFFKNLGELNNESNNNDEEIQNSSYDNQCSRFSLKVKIDENVEYDYIDLFAITQNINIQQTEKPIKIKWYKKLLFWRRKHGAKSN